MECSILPVPEATLTCNKKAMIKLTTPTVKHQATDIIDVLSPTKEAIQFDMTHSDCGIHQISNTLNRAFFIMMKTLSSLEQICTRHIANLTNTLKAPIIFTNFNHLPSIFSGRTENHKRNFIHKIPRAHHYQPV
jgi:hypothetical protein